MSNDLFAAIEALLIVVPLALSVALVLLAARARRAAGVRTVELVTDRRFLLAFFYTGALLTIYLSCLHFFVLQFYRGSP